MKLFYWQGPNPNFGDELNVWLWPRLLPDFFDDDSSTVFLGIGSILGRNLAYQANPSILKVVFGCGYVRKYFQPPNLSASDWKIYFVRGPRTIELLDLPKETPVGDSAILTLNFFTNAHRTSQVVSYMPHHESLKSGNWEKVCSLAGINMIDPRDPVETVLKEILRSKVVICEAMHGAVVADALRIPWIPALALRRAHRAKWFDWADSLGISLIPQPNFPSSVAELVDSNLPNGLNTDKKHWNFRYANDKLTEVAASKLRTLAQHPPSLSGEDALARANTMMLQKVEELKSDFPQ